MMYVYVLHSSIGLDYGVMWCLIVLLLQLDTVCTNER